MNRKRRGLGKNNSLLLLCPLPTQSWQSRQLKRRRITEEKEEEGPSPEKAEEGPPPHLHFFGEEGPPPSP